jgi:hypothetical protein
VKQRWIAVGICLLTCVLAGPALSEGERPTDPKGQVEELMNDGMTLAEKMLRERKELVPFGVVRKYDGSLLTVGAWDGRGQPVSKDLIEQLNKGFRKGAESGEYDATAVFSEVLTTPSDGKTKTDAVQIGLEHRGGYCVDVVIPYTRSPEGKIQFGELSTSKREGSAFRCN